MGIGTLGVTYRTRFGRSSLFPIRYRPKRDVRIHNTYAVGWLICHVLTGFVFFCNVLLDWLKVSVLYGVTRSVAETVDGHQGAPNGPLCTATICTFADTYFDRGIQHWVSRFLILTHSVTQYMLSIQHQPVFRYCYDRIGGNHTNLTQETFASVMTFVIVAIWQGLGYQVIVWAILNCIGLTFEYFISQLVPEEDREYKVS